MAHEVVDGGEVELHLSRVFRLERPHFQVDDHEGTELEMVEEQIDSEIFAPHLDWVLASDKRNR